MTILIGIPTFRRPNGLRRLLRSLVANIPDTDVQVCVVDNDPEGSARSVADEFSDQIPLTYISEERPGVVHVRNALVAQAKGYRALVFLDDDQWVSPEWFGALMQMNCIYPDAVLAGPVAYVLPDESPEHVRNGGFFARVDHANCEKLNTTGTGNSMIPRSVLEYFDGQAFDPTFARIGGEDTDFFLRLTGAGTEIRWAEKALVHEEVPLARATLDEAGRRYFRGGYVLATIAARSQPRSQVLVGGCARVLLGLGIYARRRISRRPMRGVDVAMLHAGRGYLAAARGKELRAYGTDGR